MTDGFGGATLGVWPNDYDVNNLQPRFGGVFYWRRL